MNAERKSPGRGRLTLIALALLFIGPLAVAMLLYRGGLWVPGGGVNHGELLQPVLSLPRDAQPLQDGGAAEGGYLLGKWSIVHLADGGCDERCAQALIKTRQVRLALARYIERTQRVVFLSDTAFADASVHPDLLVVRLSGDAGGQIRSALRAKGGGERVFIVDPLGNLILSYPLDAPPDDIHDDLKKLLRLSRIG